MGENVNEIHCESLARQSVNKGEVGEEEKLETIIIFPIYQEELNQEKKPNYDDELVNEYSLGASKPSNSYE